MNLYNKIVEQLDAVISPKDQLQEEVKDTVAQETDENLEALQSRVFEEEFKIELAEFVNNYESRLTSLDEALAETNLAGLANVSDYERTDYVNSTILEIEILESFLEKIRFNMDGDVLEFAGNTVNLIQIEERIRQFRAILAEIDTIIPDADNPEEDVEETETVDTVDEFLDLDLDARLQMICGLDLSQLSEGTEMSFRFPNKNLEYSIGLGDLLPPEYRNVESNGVIYTRQGSQGFYNNGIYLAVLNGSRVTISAEPEEYSAEEEFSSKFNDTTQEQIVYQPDEAILEGIQSLNGNDIYEYAMEFMVDPFLLQSVLTVLWESFSDQYGTESEFLHAAARFIQNAENSYRRIEGEDPIANGSYSLEFLVYALDHFNLFNYRTQRFTPDTIETVIESYGQTKGVSGLQSINLDLEETRSNMQQAYSREFADVSYNYSDAITQMTSTEMREKADWYSDRVLRGLEHMGETLEVATLSAQASEILYYNMFSREGTPYSGQVDIASVDGHRWTINNNCVGHVMRVLAGTPFAILSGRQSGFGDSNNRRGLAAVYASNWYWGDYDRAPGEVRENYLQSLVKDRSSIIGYGRGLNRRYFEGETSYEEVIDEGNVDELLGQHLADGEIAVIQFPSHVGLIYKDNSQIMLSHSPRAGSDVVTLPLARYVSMNHPDHVRIVPISTMVRDNLADSRRSQSFRDFFNDAELS